jgi:hypothetical protein
MMYQVVCIEEDDVGHDGQHGDDGGECHAQPHQTLAIHNVHDTAADVEVDAPPVPAQAWATKKDEVVVGIREDDKNADNEASDKEKEIDKKIKLMSTPLLKQNDESSPFHHGNVGERANEDLQDGVDNDQLVELLANHRARTLLGRRSGVWRLLKLQLLSLV